MPALKSFQSRFTEALDLRSLHSAALSAGTAAPHQQVQTEEMRVLFKEGDIPQTTTD
jgi:hypothetical protein